MPLHESTTAVRLTIGEDAAVLTALEELRATGDFSEELAGLERTLREKIQREG